VGLVLEQGDNGEFLRSYPHIVFVKEHDLWTPPFLETNRSIHVHALSNYNFEDNGSTLSADVPISSQSLTDTPFHLFNTDVSNLQTKKKSKEKRTEPGPAQPSNSCVSTGTHNATTDYTPIVASTYQGDRRTHSFTVPTSYEDTESISIIPQERDQTRLDAGQQVTNKAGTVLSDTDALYIPPDRKELIVSDFANRLLLAVGNVEDDDDTAEILTSELPMLLRKFALEVQSSADGGQDDYKPAITFVRQNRR
jgi:hypothetical protein